LNFKLFPLVLVFLTSAITNTTAQDSLQFQEAIAVVGRPSPDSILLRWAPLTLATWQLGNQQGYVIEKYTIAREGKIVSPPEKSTLTATPLKPLPEAQWEPLVKQDKFSAIAAQSLFGDRFEVDLGKADVFTIVNKVKENEQRFAFALFCADMSPRTAKASALWYTDKDVKKGEKYLYRVIIPQSTEQLRGSIFIGPDDPYTLPKPLNVQAEFNDRQVSLQWDKNNLGYYTAYTVERSTDGKNFTSISDTPLATLSPEQADNSRHEYATDSLADMTKIYYYRIKGITPFGENGLPSEVVSGKGSVPLADMPYITVAENIQNTSIQLTWEFPSNNIEAVKGFAVERAPRAQGTFTTLTPTLLPPDARTFEDKTPDQINYYRIIVQGIKGEQLFSHTYLAQLIDSIPPAMPTGLKATIDQQGTVALSWEANKDTDMYGYRIYRANFKDEELSQVTSEPLAPNSFTDKVNIKTLNEAVYYSVMAIDRNQNHSVLSELLRVPLPDKIKPQPPVLLPIRSGDAGPVIQWTPSGSEDVVQYDVYRRMAGKTEWQRLKIMPATNDTLYSYTDTNAEAGKLNSYTVVAIDEAGQESEPTSSVQAKKILTALTEVVEWKEPVLEKENQAALLKWTYNQPDVKFFQVYRRVGTEPLKLFKTLPGTIFQWRDNALKNANRYTYRILAVHTNGAKSALSKEMSVDF
jgi:uncharacterized protein